MFMIDSFPRAGSTTLSHILNVHPDIACCVEPFHPARFSGEFNRLAVRDGSVAHPLDLLRVRWNGIKHVWEPMDGWPFVGRKELNDDLLHHVDFVIALRRRNVLRQYVSGYISKHIKYWIGAKIEFFRLLDGAYLPPINPTEVREGLRQLVIATQRRSDLLTKIRAKHVILFYEDLFDSLQSHYDRARCCDQLFEKLGYRPLSETGLVQSCLDFFDAGEYKWASREVYERIPGIHGIEEEVGCQETGWLFR